MDEVEEEEEEEDLTCPRRILDQLQPIYFTTAVRPRAEHQHNGFGLNYKIFLIFNFVLL